MSFGVCPHTGLSFAEKFHQDVFESLPAPSQITSKVQFERAQEIEAEYGANPCSTKGRCCNKHKYFFVMINPDDNKGGYYVCPAHVKDGNFTEKYYPSNFRWFVIDPCSHEEVLFLRNEIADFWDFLPCDLQQYRKEWWFDILFAHKDILNMGSVSYAMKPETLDKN